MPSSRLQVDQQKQTNKKLCLFYLDSLRLNLICCFTDTASSIFVSYINTSDEWLKHESIAEWQPCQIWQYVVYALLTAYVLLFKFHHANNRLESTISLCYRSNLNITISNIYKFAVFNIILHQLIAKTLIQKTCVSNFLSPKD